MINRTRASSSYLSRVLSHLLCGCSGTKLSKALNPIESGCDDFRKHPETSNPAKERGCYLFAIRAAKGFRPVYVGKTKKSFGKECFTYHKIADHYQPALGDTGKGTPVMFLLTLGRAKGPVNNLAIAQLESFLIQNAVAKNPHLSNVQGTKQEEWGITGVIRGSKGKVSGAAKLFRKAMGFRTRNKNTHTGL